MDAAPRERRVLALKMLAVAAPVVLIAAIATGGGGDEKRQPDRGTPVDAARLSQIVAEQEAETPVPPLGRGMAAELRAALAEINPGLDHERSIDRAKRVCADILSGVDTVSVLQRAEYRFEGGSTGDLTSGDTAAIVAEIKRVYCHD